MISEAEFARWGMTLAVPAFILFMLFIVWDLAKKSRAGRMGTFVLFFVLAFGMLGFAAKGVLQLILKL